MKEGSVCDRPDCPCGSNALVCARSGAPVALPRLHFDLGVLDWPLVPSSELRGGGGVEWDMSPRRFSASLGGQAACEDHKVVGARRGLAILAC